MFATIPVYLFRRGIAVEHRTGVSGVDIDYFRRAYRLLSPTKATLRSTPPGATMPEQAPRERRKRQYRAGVLPLPKVHEGEAKRSFAN
jgi:hypothetical protein